MKDTKEMESKLKLKRLLSMCRITNAIANVYDQNETPKFLFGWIKWLVLD